MGVMSSLSFDIFCRVVDNYGDIGVCWRLAKDLAHRPTRHNVRLWVDDMRSFGRIEPGVEPALAEQCVSQVRIMSWNESAVLPPPHDVVIEAFACSPPNAFIEAMRLTNSLWLNLEYLSAEDWVQSCHGLPSMQVQGLEKYFFFPGFTPATAGLIREPGLLHEERNWQADTANRRNLLQDLGMQAETLCKLDADARLVFLFCYPDAPVAGLVNALSGDSRPSIILVPENVYPALETISHPKVGIQTLPFVDQFRFDRLLWSCELNLVRGEDSLVRSLWAGKPMLWQIYEQEHGIHLDKLQAWLDRTPLPADVHALMKAWNTHDAALVEHSLRHMLKQPNWQAWRVASQHNRGNLSQLTDLGTALIAFCTQKRRTR
jgi:uncharacterized repeat protein (TIGR03837 family)